MDEPYYGSLMVRSNNTKFNGGQGHVAFVVGMVLGKNNLVSYAQLGGNQAKPNEKEGTTVNVVLREPMEGIRFYHYIHLLRIPLFIPLFETATKDAEKQKGLDR